MSEGSACISQKGSQSEEQKVSQSLSSSAGYNPFYAKETNQLKGKKRVKKVKMSGQERGHFRVERWLDTLLSVF